MRKISRRNFFKWLGKASVAGGAAMISGCSMYYDVYDDMDVIRIKPPRTSRRSCPHKFCRYYQPLSGDGVDEGYCASKAFFWNGRE